MIQSVELIYAGITTKHGHTVGLIAEHEEGRYAVRRALSLGGKLSEHAAEFAAALLEEQAAAFLRRNAEAIADDRGRRAARLRLQKMGVKLLSLEEGDFLPLSSVTVGTGHLQIDPWR